MELPNSIESALGLFVLVGPGISYEVVRTRLRGYGPRDREVATRIVQAVLVSVIFDLVYLFVFGQHAINAVGAKGDDLHEDPRRLALIAFGLGIALPAASAQVIHGGIELRPLNHPALSWLPSLPRFKPSAYQSAPTAWDKAAVDLGGCWVRVRLPEGRWVGGWYSGNSYVSTYPEPRDIYIEDQHEIGPDGLIGAQIPYTAGVWVPITEGTLVEWIKGDYSP